MAWYRTGTVSVTNGSTTVTGSGTSWIDGAASGEGFYGPDGNIYEIASIVSATQITLGSAYLGATSSGQAYQIIPSQSYIRSLAAQAAALVNDYASVLSNAGLGKFSDGTVSAPGIRFSSDENTGIRRVGSDTLALVTGGADRVSVSTTAVSVTGNLSVSGSITGSFSLAGDTTLGDAVGDLVTINGTTTFTNANPTLSAGTANGVLYLNGSKVATSGSALTFDGTKLSVSATSGETALLTATGVSNYLSIKGDTGGTTIWNGIGTDTGVAWIGSVSNHAVSFRQNNSEQMRLTSTGLGIGTTPTAKLEVVTLGLVALFGSNTTQNAYTGWKYNATTLGYVGNGAGVAAGGGATDFAIGSTGARALVFGTNDTERMRLDSSGNLGIGTTSPGAKLDVAGTIRTSGAPGVATVLINTTSAGVSGGITLQRSGTVKRYLGLDASDNFAVIDTGGGSQLVIDASGNLGIGTISPSTKLHVMSAASSVTLSLSPSNSNTNIGYITNDGTYLSLGSAYNSTGVKFRVALQAPDNAATLDSSGNLGIGESNPSQRLHVKTSAAPIALFDSTEADGGYLTFSRSGTPKGYIGSSYHLILPSGSNDDFAVRAVNNLIFATGAAEQMRLTSTGLGIGTSSPGYKLDVNGTGRCTTEIRVKNSAGNVSYLTFEENGNGNSASFISGDARTSGNIGFWTNSTLRATLDSSGNLGLGVTPSAWAGGIKVIEFGSIGGLAAATIDVNMLYNVYYDGVNKYRTNGYASNFQHQLGAFKWFTAPSGNAGDPISFTQAMTLDANGNLLFKQASTGTTTIGFQNFSGTQIQRIQYDDADGSLAVGGGTALAYPLKFFSGNTQAMTLDASGNLGVGTTLPSSYGLNSRVIHVDGGANASEIKLTNSTSGSLGATGLVLQLNGNDAYLWNGENSFLSLGTNNQERARLDSSGNLGLGVTPSAWTTVLPVLQVSNASFTGYNNQAIVSSNFYYDAGNKYIANGFATQYAQSSGSHIWYTAPNNTSGAGAGPISFSQAMTLDASGNLSVGTTSTTGRVTVDSSVNPIIMRLRNSSASSYTSFRLYNDIDLSNRALEIDYFGSTASGGERAEITTTGAYPLLFLTNNIERARIDSSGNFIQTVNTTAATLTTNQTLTFSIVDDSTLRISVRGSDGTTRTATVALT